MPREELLFSDYMAIILRRKWFIAAITLLMTVGTYWWTYQERMLYRSKTRIKIQRQVTFAELSDSVLASSGDPLQNYTYEITSTVVASNAAQALAFPELPTPDDIVALRNSVKVAVLENTDILEITTLGDSPLESKRRGEAVVAAFTLWHDKMMTQNALTVYQSILESRNAMVNSFKQREAELLQSLGARVMGGAEADELVPLRTVLMELQSQLQQLRASGNYTEAYPGIVDLKARIKQMEDELNNKLKVELEKRAQLSEYERDKLISADIGAFFSRKIEEAKITANKKNEIVTVVEPTTEGQPIGTAKTRKTVAGVLLGLMLGIVLAFVVDTLDTSIRTLGEVEDLFHLPVLGVIPHFSHHDVIMLVGRRRWVDRFIRALPLSSLRVLWHILSDRYARRAQGQKPADDKPPELIVPFMPRSPATEAYRTLRTNLELTLREGSKSLLVTSAGPGEGKTTTLVNLAVIFAQAGKKVLLVSANLRRPQSERIFGLNRENGLSDILMGDIQWRAAVKDYRDVALGESAGHNLATMAGMDKLFFITCGGRTIHPAEWLGQPIFANLVNEWTAEYEVVLIDAPPILPVPDSVIIANAVKHTLLVYQIGVTARETVRRAITALQNTGTTLVGIVINDLRASWADHAEFFHYHTYYGRKE